MRRRGEGGVATVTAVVWMMLLLLVVWIGLLTAVAAARQHDLDGAADLVALSAAADVPAGGEPCAKAADIARLNDVRMTDCELLGDDVRVTVIDELQLPMGIERTIESQARAGP